MLGGSRTGIESSGNPPPAMLPKGLGRAPSGGSISEVYLGAPFRRVFLKPSIEEVIEIKRGRHASDARPETPLHRHVAECSCKLTGGVKTFSRSVANRTTPNETPAVT